MALGPEVCVPAWNIRRRHIHVCGDVMTELEQYKAMLKRAGLHYYENKRDNGNISITVETEYAMWHLFSSAGNLIEVGATY